MRNKTRLFGIYLPFFTLITLSAIALKTVALIKPGYFNFEYSYFISKTMPTIANALIAAAIFFFIIYIIGTKKTLSFIPNFASPYNYIPSAALGAALIFMSANLLLTITPSDTTITMVISITLAVLAIFSTCYLIFNTVFVRKISAIRANSGLYIVVFLSLYLAYLYISTKTAINSPIKSVDQLAFAFNAVFFLYEIRLSLGREKWKAYIIFGFIAAILSAYSSIPALIVYFSLNKVISDSVYESILTFTIFIFIASKLIGIDKLTRATESPFITKLKGSAANRETELNPTQDISMNSDVTEDHDIPDKNQISILDAQNTQEKEITFDATDFGSEELTQISEEQP